MKDGPEAFPGLYVGHRISVQHPPESAFNFAGIRSVRSSSKDRRIETHYECQLLSLLWIRRTVELSSGSVSNPFKAFIIFSQDSPNIS